MLIILIKILFELNIIARSRREMNFLILKIFLFLFFSFKTHRKQYLSLFNIPT